jgi:3-polyprenyl-4-hydroxybenzoate decarboxylase
MDNKESMRIEALGDLRKCLAFAKEMGCLEIVEGADPNLEMGALHELSLKDETPPILWFRDIKGFGNCSVAVNVRSAALFEIGVGLERVQYYRKHRRKKVEPFTMRRR